MVDHELISEEGFRGLHELFGLTTLLHHQRVRVANLSSNTKTANPYFAVPKAIQRLRATATELMG